MLLTLQPDYNQTIYRLLKKTKLNKTFPKQKFIHLNNTLHIVFLLSNSEIGDTDYQQFC